MLAEILEMVMMISFGLAWPASIMRSYRSRTTKGKSIAFLLAIDVGYLCGIASKFVAGNVSFVVVFYIFNFLAVSLDAALYFRNLRIDRMEERARREAEQEFEEAE